MPLQKKYVFIWVNPNPYIKYLIAVLSCSIFFAAELAIAASTVPSMTLPESFQRPETESLNSFKKKNLPTTNIEKTNDLQQEVGDLKIVTKTLIFLAPKNLQKKVNFLKYEQEIVGKPKKIEDFYQIAKDIAKEYRRNGFPLVRVIVPKQELKPDNATVFLKVIDGFIEKVDLRKVPVIQTLRTFAYLKPLINKKALTSKLLERQLLLAGNTAGLTLKSALIQGNIEGGAILVVDAKHKYLSGSMQFNNSQSKELGRHLGQKSVTFNSPSGFGESITFFGLSKPTWKGMKGTGDNVRIRGGGFAASLPIGNNGLNSSIAYIESMTRPGVDLQVLGIEANMKSATFTINYPLILKKDSLWTLRGTVNWADEIQQTNISGEDEQLSHDRLTSLRIGLNFSGCQVGCATFDTEISRGIEIASRSASDSAGGTPLSRASGTSTYTHFKVDSSYSYYLYQNIETKVNAGGQYTDDGLLNSEQATIIGEDKISALTAGAISGDKIWYIRGELNYKKLLSPNLSASPFFYSAMGVAFLNKATATENKKTAAKSVGFGLKINGNDKFFFDKNITAKIEFSKTWATKRIEDLSDVRMKKHQALVSLAMTY